MSANLVRMATLVRILFAGYGSAATMACALFMSGFGWVAALLVFWIGGAGLCLAFAALIVWLRPHAIHAGAPAGHADEFRRWDSDTAAERFETYLRLEPVDPMRSTRTGQARKLGA